MKKAFDQTVRDLKREVNKKVLKVPSVEQKVLDATSNEPWGPHGSNLADIAQATRNYHEYQIIMNVIWKRISDTGKNWRHVYKGLTVLEYLVAHGSERIIDEIKEHAYQISTLSNFQYIDSSGRDQGNNVRKKSQSLVNLVNDKERIQELRQKAQANREKYRSSFSTGRPGGYGDRYDDDRYGRDEDRYGYGRDRESGDKDDDRYGRNGEPYGREGDRYSRDSDERYDRDRDSYRDDDYKGSRGNDDYGSRNGSLHRDRSFDDDDHYSSRSRGGRNDDPQDERQLEHRLSVQSGGAPPSYEEATRDAQNLEQEFGDRNGGNVARASPKAPSAAGASPKASSAAVPSPEVASSTAPSELSNAAPVTVAADVTEPTSFGGSGFDEFDPRGFVSATASAATAATSLEMDLFGSSLDPLYSLALMPVDPTTAYTETDVSASSSLGTDFGNPQPGENPFGDPPFKAIPDNFQVHQESFAPDASFQSPISTGAPENLTPAAPKLESTTSFDFGGSFGAINYGSTISTGQENPVANQAVIFQEVPLTPGNDDLTSLLAPQAGYAAFNPPVVQPAAPVQTAGILPQQTGLQAPFAPHISQFTPQTVPVTGLASQGTPQFMPQAANFTGLTSQGTPQFTPQAAQVTGLSSQGSQFTPQTAQVSRLTSQGAPQATYPDAPTNMQPAQMNFTSQSGTSLQSTQMNQMNLLSQPGIPGPISREVAAPMPTMLPVKNPSNDKFETKSTVWADTLSRGLVNLNISGPKINPHADIGIDFDSMNRKEKRTEKKDSSAAPVTSTITMGKAMGSGSGMGRSGASGLTRPTNPMMGPGMGMGMGGNPGMGMGGGYGGSMNQPMGMGMGMNQPMGMNMGMGMGMNMGMNQGMPMRPAMGMPPGGPGMPGAGYNPMSGYGSQQPYGGGYR